MIDENCKLLHLVPDDVELKILKDNLKNKKRQKFHKLKLSSRKDKKK